MDFPDVPVRLSGGTLGGGGGCLGGGLGAQASVTSFPPTLEPWQVLQLFVVGDFGPVLATPVEPSREAK